MKKLTWKDTGEPVQGLVLELSNRILQALDQRGSDYFADNDQELLTLCTDIQQTFDGHTSVTLAERPIIEGRALITILLDISPARELSGSFSIYDPENRETF